MQRYHKILIHQLNNLGIDPSQLPADLLLSISDSYSDFESKITEENNSSKSDFELMMNRLPGYVSWVNKDLEYLGVNSNLENIIGISKNEIIGKKVGDVLGRNNEIFQVKIRAFAASELEEDQFEYSTKFNNIESHILTYLQKFSSEKKILICGIDLTEKVNIQKKLDESRLLNEEGARLASIGELSAGMAHEINNPLMVIQGNCFLIEKHSIFSSIESEKIFRQRIEKVNNNIQRVVNILDSLKVLSQKDIGQEWDAVDIDQIVNQSLQLCQNKITNSAVKFDVSCQADVQVNCIPSDIVKVIFSLISNSLDAVEHHKVKWIKLDVFERDNLAIIKITDCGHGIKKEIIQKIFDPFFSTKAPGKGSGLGLSISKKLMMKYGGDLSYYSSSGHTCFEISLPLMLVKKELKSA